MEIGDLTQIMEGREEGREGGREGGREKGSRTKRNGKK